MGADGRTPGHWPARPAGIAYGGDYNPDQWPEATWHEDVALMREAGVTLVSVGVFSWSRIQPAPDRWDLDWLVRALDLLHEAGIAVDLATATASPPPWFSLAHPESRPVTADGVRLEIGSRQHLCPSSSAFRAAAAALVERLATTVGSHPAVVMWHIGNEYGDHVRECFCDASAADFRRWLADRYGSLDALNDAWTTSVWSGRFGAWDEVMPPRTAPGPSNPAQIVDWRRFSSDALLACFEAERAILARLTPALPVTTNFMLLNDRLDHRRWGRRLGLVSVDLYPDPATEEASEVESALTQDLMRSLGDGRPWLLLEQAPSAVNWRPLNVPKRPGLMRALSLGAVGRGADGILFFQWRGARGGAEMFHSTLLPVGGTGTRGWRRTVELGRDLARLAEVAGSRVEAETALILDWEAWWALEQGGHPTSGLRYRDEAIGWYGPLHRAGVAVDVRGPDEPLDRYRLVVAPNLFMLDPAAADALARYVEAGGILLLGTASGLVDRAYHVPGGHHPALLRELAGIRWEETWPILGPGPIDGPGGASLAFDAAAVPGAGPVAATIQREALELAGATAVARHVGGELDGWPAVTRRAVGAGEVWYVGTAPDPAGRERLIAALGARAGVAPVAPVPPGVRVARRVGEDASFLVYVNHAPDRRVVVAPGAGLDLLTGRPIAADEALSLEPLDAVVLRLARG